MMMEGAGATAAAVSNICQIDRTSSIENEPRTLHIDQLEHAREAALYMLKNAGSVEDALRIFTEGLEPARMTREAQEDARPCEEAEEEARNHHCHHHQNSCFKEIATAPF